MSDQRWPNAILKENGWHYVGICRACWAKETITSALWAKWRLRQRHLSTLVQQYSNKMPTLALRMTAIWDEWKILTSESSESIIIDFSIRKALFWIYGSNRFSIILKCFSYIDSFYVQGDVKKNQRLVR